MLMGLTDAPATFMQTMNNLFMDMIDIRVVVFLDDILIYSMIAEEHFELLEKVFTHMHKHVFYSKLKKCSFLGKTTTLLEFNITPQSMHINIEKVKIPKKWLKSATI